MEFGNERQGNATVIDRRYRLSWSFDFAQDDGGEAREWRGRAFPNGVWEREAGKCGGHRPPLQA